MAGVCRGGQSKGCSTSLSPSGPRPDDRFVVQGLLSSCLELPPRRNRQATLAEHWPAWGQPAHPSPHLRHQALRHDVGGADGYVVVLRLGGGGDHVLHTEHSFFGFCFFLFGGCGGVGGGGPLHWPGEQASVAGDGGGGVSAPRGQQAACMRTCASRSFLRMPSGKELPQYSRAPAL